MHLLQCYLFYSSAAEWVILEEGKNPKRYYETPKKQGRVGGDQKTDRIILLEIQKGITRKKSRINPKMDLPYSLNLSNIAVQTHSGL